MAAIYAKYIVAQAQAWLGKKESNNSHRSIIDVYNKHKPLARGYKVKYSDSWCATFVSAVAINCGATAIIPTECSCIEMIKLFKKLGCWVESDTYKPKAGDIIFYDWDDSGKGDNTGAADHTGIVEKVSGSTITVIEGNYKNSVARRSLKVNGKYIRGYGVPKYTAVTKSIEAVAKEVLAGKWGNGEARKKALTAAGYDAAAVQSKVNELSAKKATPTKSIEAVAKEVLAGKWGNGEARKKALTAAGYDAAAVQSKVNALCRKKGRN